VSAALAEARRIAGPDGLVVVTGSIYIVGEVMQVLGVRI
jgi:folylpolyglutamate synthase/dihydropteroate synthase